ncbi:hypothetical protein ABLT35_16435 [Acinetobacter johnsonii]|jgi:hypothetical protein|uniref:hypothetical protein n=1 Tax=Acinetobacter johnsonii TaxID=40214 RepID=UPI00244B9005|nr:hypothetical protein [Acinetobacter johnsonii]MDH1408844.1 hypothetical protein [Acinetobacter johnsonii]
MDIFQFLELEIAQIANQEDEVQKYAQYRYCFGVLETLLALGEVSTHKHQLYSAQIRSDFDALSYVMKLRGL